VVRPEDDLESWNAVLLPCIRIGSPDWFLAQLRVPIVDGFARMGTARRGRKPDTLLKLLDLEWSGA